MSKTNTTETETRYAIIRMTGNGRTWMQSRAIGEITTLRAKTWSTTDRGEAERLAAALGGHVVSQW